ncbi:flagellin N-terminal helical domain-containing protein [Natronospora cellulosivora (SeqCode)]
MRINNNMMAMNSHRQLTANQNAGAKSMERLSSGLRINRAGDDAAGLSISEKMRGQIRGLNQASRNAQDGISLIQTAEGALNETHSILQRMRELAVQSANDTNVGIDRQSIQDEMNQLQSEIDRISDTTEFNTQTLLDGSFKGSFQIGANEGQNVDLQINAMNSSNLGLTSTISTAQGTTSNNEDNALLADGIYTVDDSNNLLDTSGNVVAVIDAAEVKVGEDEVMDLTDSEILAEGAQVTISNDGANYDIKNTVDPNVTENLAAGNYEITSGSLIKDGNLVDATVDLTNNEIVLADGTVIEAAELGLDDEMFADGLEFTINGVDVSERANAEASISTINSAIEEVSTARSNLGAMQNRLEHSISNLDTSAENLQAAESRIRDLDMAQEMMDFTKSNILNQAATAMLAQANQAPQSVLQLLG